MPKALTSQCGSHSICVGTKQVQYHVSTQSAAYKSEEQHPCRTPSPSHRVLQTLSWLFAVVCQWRDRRADLPTLQVRRGLGRRNGCVPWPNCVVVHDKCDVAIRYGHNEATDRNRKEHGRWTSAESGAGMDRDG